MKYYMIFFVHNIFMLIFIYIYLEIVKERLKGNKKYERNKFR
jgi:hypothetical protein